MVGIFDFPPILSLYGILVCSRPKSERLAPVAASHPRRNNHGPVDLADNSRMGYNLHAGISVLL